MDAFDEDGLRSICSDFLTRSSSLKCFVSKFLLKLRNDALFKQHLHVTDELRRHLEENAVGEGGVAVVADDVEPVQSSPPADSPCASSCVTSRSLDAYMTPLRYDPSQSSIADATGGVENISAGGNSGSGGAGSSSQDFGRTTGVTCRDALLDPAAGASSIVALASPSIQASSVLSSAALPQFMQSLTPLGGSGSGSSKDMAIEGGAKNAASSFTSQDNLTFQAPQPQGQAQQQHLVQLTVNIGDPAVLKEVGQVRHQDQGDALQSSEQKQLQQQQKAASALAKYQEFLRQQQQMPPPQSNQLMASSTNRADAIMVSVSQQTSQPQLLAAELHPVAHHRSEGTVSEGQLPVQLRYDSSRTTIHDTLTPSSAANVDATSALVLNVTLAQSPPPLRDDTLPLCSSPALSLSLSFNPSHFPTSPNAAQAPSSPMASRLPKVLPPGDGRVGFIVLPAAAHADAAAVVSTAAIFSVAAVNNDALSIMQVSSRANPLSAVIEDKLSISERMVESDGSDSETQGSDDVDEAQEETLVIPETPTGTPIQPKAIMPDNFGASGSGSRRPRPQPVRLAAADSADVARLNSSSKGSDGGSTSAHASTSSGKFKRNVVYAKIVALPTQPSGSSAVSSSRVSSRGRPIRPKVNFDSLPLQNNFDSPESVTKSSAARHSRIERGTCAVSTSASANELNGEGSGGQESEDDVPMVRPMAASASRRAAPSAAAVASAESHNQTAPASVKRARARCNEVTQMQFDAMKFKQQQQHQQQQQQHCDRLLQSALVQAASDPALPSLELRHMSFIVTNVSSENTVDISKGQLDRTGTSKKVLVARATALGMTAWTAGASLCSVYLHSAPLSQPVCAVANVTSSAVIASSCPPPPHLVVMCETVVSASTQMLVALALGVTPLHCSWLSSCACAHTSLSPITDSFVLPLDAIIPKEYARLSTARVRHARVTPLPLEGRALGGRRLGYYSQGANAARIGTVLSFAGAVVTPIDAAAPLHAQGCEYIVVDGREEALTLGNNHVPFDWVIAVLCIGYVQPLALSLVSTLAAQTPVGLRSSRAALKRADATAEVTVVKETPIASKRTRTAAPSPTYGSGGGDACRSSGSALAVLRPASPASLFSRGSSVSPSQKSASASSKLVEGAKAKAAATVRDARIEGSRASPAHVTDVTAGIDAAQIPSCFTLFDPKTKAHLRFDESGSVTSKVYSKEASSNCMLHAVESEQHGPYPHRLRCEHKSFLCVGRDGSVSLAEKGAGGRAMFKFAQGGSTRKGATYEVIHESGRFLSLNASGAVVTTDSATHATKWQLQPFQRNKKAR